MAAQALQKKEDWGTSAEDALRVSILSKDVSQGTDVAKWNLEKQGSDGKYAVIDSNPYDVMPASSSEVPVLEAVPKLKPVEPEDAETEVTIVEPSTTTAIGIYASTDEYFNTLIDELSRNHLNNNFVRYSEEIQSQIDSNDLKLDGLIVNMSEEDESALLDMLLDKCDEVETLFLCDETPSKRCFDKIDEFMEEHDLLH